MKNLLTALVQMLTETGFINVDINDFALEALEQALNNPLVSIADISSARGVIIQIFCRNEISLKTYNSLIDKVQVELIANKALVIAGVTLHPELDCEIEVMVIASGINGNQSETLENANDAELETHYFLENEQTECVTKGDENYLHIPTYIRNQSNLKTEGNH